MERWDHARLPELAGMEESQERMESRVQEGAGEDQEVLRSLKREWKVLGDPFRDLIRFVRRSLKREWKVDVRVFVEELPYVRSLKREWNRLIAE